MRYYLVAGEASGDLHGSLLTRELILQDPAAVIRFIGGDLMAAETGHTPFMHYRDMAFMGFLEVVKHLRTIFKNLARAEEDITAFKPNVVILIDYPGFNLRLAKALHKLGLPVYYFISPKVWAWNERRVLKIKRDITHMFVIFSFEVDFYARWGMKVDYVGNPLMDAIEEFRSGWKAEANQFKPGTHLIPEMSTRPVIALLPGSRKQEISHVLPQMLAVVSDFDSYDFIVAKAPGLDPSFYLQFLARGTGHHVSLSAEKTYELLSRSRAALVTSGTATLETALFKVPEVVLYKTSPISATIARAVILVKFISLVNLIMGKEVVKELIQAGCTPVKIRYELGKILVDGVDRTRQLDDYELLAAKVGGPGAAARAAKLMYHYLKEAQ